MNVRASTNIVMEAFDAVQRRDPQRLARLYHPEVEFCWPPPLPYGGSFRGIAGQQDQSRTTWEQIRDPLHGCSHPASGWTWKRWAFTESATGNLPGSDVLLRHRSGAELPPAAAMSAVQPAR